MWQWHALESAEICFEKDSEESKMKPRFLAEEDGEIGLDADNERDGLSIFEVCCGKPMSRNSVFDGFNVRQLADIQEEMRETVD